MIPEAYLISDEEHLARLDEAMRAQPRSFTDLDPFFEGGRHVLIHGRTGSGKTTLLLTLLRELHRSGHRILMRDDGGLEFLYLLPEIPMVVWIPEGCIFTVEGPYDVEVRDFILPSEILEAVFETRQRFHVIIYDAYCYDPGLAASFYSDLFQTLIFKCMQTERSLKRRLVFSFDELNDLIQPKGRELTKGHASVRRMVEYNIRKLRKHKVTLIASTHRFNQIGINVRSQFSYIWIKQSYGYDVYDFINKNLVTAANQTFWRVLRELTSMGPEYVYLFDYQNRFDRFIFPDIPRPDITYSLKGLVREQVKRLTFDGADLLIAALRVAEPPKPYSEIAGVVGLAKSTVVERAKRLKEIPALLEVMR